MKIAILGSTGMLGSMLAYYLKDKHQIQTPKFDASVVTVDELTDILKGNQWVINAIGAIPRRCTADFMFWKLNAWLPAKLARVAENTGMMVINPATDCVYDGSRGDYTELDAASPIDVYGESKLQGEIESSNVINLRCSLIGPESHGKSLLNWFLSQPKGASVDGYLNHFWNGITTLHFAKICEAIIDTYKGNPSTQHIVPTHKLNKYKLLHLFAKYYDRGDIQIVPTEHEKNINRTLETIFPVINDGLWLKAGYQRPPTIENMIEELARYR